MNDLTATQPDDVAQTDDATQAEPTAGLPPEIGAAIEQLMPAQEGYAATQTDDTEQRAAEAALIGSFMQDAKLPDYEQDVLTDLDVLRKYIHTDVMQPKDQGAVAENLIIRNQNLKMAQIWASDPNLNVEPVKLLPPRKPTPPAPSPLDSLPPEIMAQMPPQAAQEQQDRKVQQMQVMQQYAQEMFAFQQQLADATAFADTVEIIVKHFSDEAGLKQSLNGGLQDVQTDGILWCKVTWQETYGKDPLGVNRPDDFSDTVARLMMLAEEFKAGDFTASDAKYQEMKDLADTVKTQIGAERWGQQQQAIGGADPRELSWGADGKSPVPEPDQIPEIPHRHSFAIDIIMPEDIVRDWDITKPEEFRRCTFIQHITWMTNEDIKTQFGVTDEDLEAGVSSDAVGRGGDGSGYVGGAQGAVNKTDPADRSNLTKRQHNNRRAVWERWDRTAKRRYVWVDGCDWFLINEVPKIVSKYWYPFFLLVFNRVTGRFMPISDAKILKPLNDEYNLMRSHDRKARRAAYNKYVIGPGVLVDDEKDKLESAAPEAVIEVTKPDDVRKSLMVVVGSAYKPELYRLDQVKQAFNEAGNTPSSARGDTEQAKFATSDQIANEQMNRQTDRTRGILEQFLSEIFTHMTDILVQVLPETNAKAIAGPGAFWPMIGRQELWQNLDISIVGGSTGKPEKQKNLDLLNSAADIMQKLGIGQPGSPWLISGLEVWKMLLDTLGYTRDPEKFVSPAPPPMLPPPPPGAPPGAPSPSGDAPGGTGAPAGPQGPPSPPPPPAT